MFQWTCSVSDREGLKTFFVFEFADMYSRGVDHSQDIFFDKTDIEHGAPLYSLWYALVTTAVWVGVLIENILIFDSIYIITYLEAYFHFTVDNAHANCVLGLAWEKPKLNAASLWKIPSVGSNRCRKLDFSTKTFEFSAVQTFRSNFNKYYVVFSTWCNN